MSFFVRFVETVTGASVRGIDEHPAWLLRCLIRARIRRHHDGSLLVTIEADDAVGMHRNFARLRPRLVTADNREILLTVVDHTRDSGFPVRCIVRPRDAVAFDANGNIAAQKLRLSYRDETRDLDITNAAETANAKEGS